MHPMNDSVYWKPFADSAQVLGGFATVVGVLIATLAAFSVVVQIWWSRRISREMSALETHRDYIRLCIERPELSSSDQMLQHLKLNAFTQVFEEPTNKETERALWFLSYVLHTMEQLLDTTRGLFGPDKAWLATITSQLSYHASLLAVAWPSWEDHYSERLHRVIEGVLAQEQK